MYSEALEKIFHSEDIHLGDTVKLTVKGKNYEGILMQRPESGDSSIVIIKLKNGYNIGVKFSKDSTIKKIRGGAPMVSEGKGLKFDGSLGRVELLYTGGTIGSKVDYLTGGVHMLTKPEELLDSIPEIAGIANIRLRQLMSIASEDISYLEWQNIAKSAADSFNDGARGILITHGTDTMHYTSAALSFMLKNLSGPVVMVGAQRSPDRGSSDAFMNMVCGAHIAANSDAAEVGVCMHASSSDDFCNFIRGTHVRKLHTSRRDAFQAVNNKPIARVGTGGRIEYLSNYKRASGEREKVNAVVGFDPKVAMIKVHPNSDPDILEYYHGKGYKGAIIEGTGLGHAPVSTEHKQFNWLGGIEKAVDDGMIIGMTSQCVNGRVNYKVYRNLRLIKNAGAIFCEDMMPEVAYVKLGWLLGNYRKDEAAKMLPQNLVGEISKRSEVDWFGENNAQ